MTQIRQCWKSVGAITVTEPGALTCRHITATATWRIQTLSCTHFIFTRQHRIGTTKLWCHTGTLLQTALGLRDSPSPKSPSFHTFNGHISSSALCRLTYSLFRLRSLRLGLKNSNSCEYACLIHFQLFILTSVLQYFEIGKYKMRFRAWHSNAEISFHRHKNIYFHRCWEINI
jgi:hypothetical protein